MAAPGAEIRPQRPTLDVVKVRETLERLCERIDDRFPGSGLGRVARQLLAKSRDTAETLAWIERPDPRLRLAIGALLLLSLALLVLAIGQVRVDGEALSPAELVSMLEAGTSELLLIGAAVLFLVGFETRTKRRRVVAAVNELRALAHVIDAHQLTKDPAIRPGEDTLHSPKRDLTPYQLSRYLDYCTELLSLSGKIGFLYVQNFPDPASQESVNELENLTTALDRKIWQKLMILHQIHPELGQSEAAPRTPASSS
jgi:hypothetical protein